MGPMQVFYLICFYGPTPFAAFLAGWQALQCKSPWHAFFVGFLGTVAMALMFGVAADYMPIAGNVSSLGQLWLLHLAVSPIVGLPLGGICAYQVAQRETPPDQVI
jgi:ABC-type uncharacterized transport system permease subunit